MPDTPMTPEAARRRVRELRDLYVHATVFGLANLLIFAIDVLTPGGPWFFWPLLVWGIGMVSHAASVLGAERFWNADWEARKIDELTAPRH